MPPWRSVGRSKFLRAIVAAIALCLVAWGIDFAWRNASYPNEKFKLRGIPNFGRIKEGIYRGGQPSNEGLAGLQALGVKTIISFTLGEEGAKTEAAEAARLGMDYIGLPWSTEEIPEPDQVRTFLSYLREHHDRPVFVHCKAGADRTGVMIALSRIALDGWPAQRAVDEMNAFHYHFIFLPHLQRFVEGFRPGLGP